jgi:hypothetical protein
MSWTKEQIEKIPLIYQDTLLALEPILRSRESPLRINGIHASRLIGLGERHGLTSEGMKQVLHNLESRSLIEIDKLGFVQPTANGEDLINAIQGSTAPPSEEVPPFPDFSGSPS